MNAAPRRRWEERRAQPPTLAVALWISDRVRPLLRLLGIDYPTFRLVLQNRLRLDNAINLGGQSGGVRLQVGLTLMCIWMLLQGLIAGLVAVATRDPMLWMVLGQGLWMGVLSILAVNHYGNVLIDGTDVGVLGSLPIHDRTVFASRLAHVLLDLTFLGLCASFFPTLLGCFAFPPLAVLAIYPASTLLATLLVVGLLSLCYTILLRALGPARFQRATFWTQIGGATLIVFAFQVGPILVPWKAVGEMVKSKPGLAILFPPLHYEALFRVSQGETERLDLVLALAAIAAPLIFAAIAFRLASHHFVAALADSGAIVRARSEGFRSGWLARLGPRICTTSVARAAYGFALAMSRREKTFLRGLLPATAMFLAMGVGLALPSLCRLGGLDSQFAAFGLYYAIFVSVGALHLSRMSDHSQARWWFDALPVENDRELMEGGAKAIIVGTILPIVLIMAAVVQIVAGPSTFPDIAQAVLASAALSTLLARWYLDEIPFTIPPGTLSDFEGFIKLIGVVLLTGLLVGVHAGTRLHWISQAAAIAAFAALFVFGWRGLARLRPRQRFNIQPARAPWRRREGARQV